MMFEDIFLIYTAFDVFKNCSKETDYVAIEDFTAYIIYLALNTK